MAEGISAGKVLVGCGCLGVVGAGVVLVLVLGTSFFVGKKLVDDNKETISQGKELFKTIKDSNPQKLAKSKTLKSGKKSAAALERDMVWKWVQTPLTEKEINQHIKFMKDWEGSASVKNFKAAAKELQALSKKPKNELTAAQKMKMMSKGLSFYKNSAQSMQEFDTLSQTYGGSQKVLSRLFRVAAVISAAESVATRTKLKPEQNAVAAKMKQLHAPASKDYTQWKAGLKLSYGHLRNVQKAAGDIEKIQALSKTFDKDQKAFKKYSNMHTKDPGWLILGKLAPETIGAWKNLPNAQRADLIKNYAVLPSLPHWAFLPKGQNKRVVASWVLAHDVIEIQRMMLGVNGTQKPKEN